ncbi:hypothetical protein ACMFMG_007582 [Clarireedia jacksonii]
MIDRTNYPVTLMCHPRACSTAFERVFIKRPDAFNVYNEPFADVHYYGPEARCQRHRVDGVNQVFPGYENCTYASRVEEIEAMNNAEEGKRAFFKDLAFQLVKAPDGTQELAPSFHMAPGAEPDNPTSIPVEILRRWRWTFLIRNPHESIPSLYRLSMPERRNETRWNEFQPSEAGYKELRRLFDYLMASKVIDPEEVCLVDAEDLLSGPERTVQAYCRHIGIDYKPEMLQWEADDTQASEILFSYKAFHTDALKSTGLKKRERVKVLTFEEENLSWQKEFGQEGAEQIRNTIEENMKDYEYLRSFRLKFD